MNQMVFAQRVRKHFGFLESEYGFKITMERNSDVHPQTDGTVIYTSATTGLVIDSDRGSVALRFYRLRDGDEFYLTPIDIDEYLNTSTKEKELLLSTDPKDLRTASALFNERFLLNRPEWKTEASAPQDKVESELANFGSWLRRHASECIQGDFSRWPAFYEYKTLRTRADHLRRGKDEMMYTRARDTDGNYKMTKQSVFKDDLEYIVKLKEESSK